MVIDFHTHIFPDKIAQGTLASIGGMSGLTPFFDGTAHGLMESMERAEVDYSVVLPVVTKPSQFRSVNTFAAEVNDKFSKRNGPKLISFGGIHPDSNDYKAELKEIVNLGLKGIKLHPDYQKVMIDDIRYLRIIDLASELGLIVSIHSGVDIGLPEVVHCTVKAAKHMIHEVQPEKLVLAHYGGYDLWNEVEEELVGENVFLDTAFLFHAIGEEQFLRILRAHGSEKILFATDCPWSGQKESLESLRKMNLTREETENILYKNADGLLKR